MALITLRSVKGSPLTIAEADANFTNLNTEVGQKLDAVEYNAADILTKLRTVDGSTSGLDADLLDGLNSSNSHIPDTASIVARDTSGNFSATTVSANLIGNVTGNVIGNLTGTVTGNATNVDGVVAINNGGTGGTTVSAARTNLGLGTIATQAANSVNITGGTISGITDLAIVDGGTGASNATQARTNLGLVIGADVQPFDGDLTAIAALTTTGIIVRSGSNSAITRNIVAGTNIASITNADGVSGNITINGTQTPTISSIIKTGTNGSGNIGQSDNRFGTIFGTATTAQYADLAEKYTTDQEYDPGTVVVVSMDDSGAEATKSWISSQRVLGVVSTNPAFLMNDAAPGQAIALRGRVPVKVVGPIRKGQPLISNQEGCGIFGDTPNTFAIALETNQEAGIKLVECVIL
jgi:hypothetical protein